MFNEVLAFSLLGISFKFEKLTPGRFIFCILSECLISMNPQIKSPVKLALFPISMCSVN